MRSLKHLFIYFCLKFALIHRMMFDGIDIRFDLEHACLAKDKRLICDERILIEDFHCF